MPNPKPIERDVKIVWELIRGGIKDDAAIASAGGLPPYRHLDKIEFVKRVRALAEEMVDLQYPIWCNHGRHRIKAIPCMSCNGPPPFANLPPSYTIRGPEWDRDRRRIALAEGEVEEQRRKKNAAARAKRKKAKAKAEAAKAKAAKAEKESSNG